MSEKVSRRGFLKGLGVVGLMPIAARLPVIQRMVKPEPIPAEAMPRSALLGHTCEIKTASFVAGAPLCTGDIVYAETTGLVAPASPENRVIGVALSGATSGEIVPVMIGGKL